MAYDQVTLYNQAISAAGGKAVIADPAEKSREANLCRLWFESVRDNVQQAGPWPSTKAHKRLALLSSRAEGDWVDTDPAPGYQYAYASPSDMLRPRHLYSGQRFERTAYAGGSAIMTNEPKALLVYTRRVTDVSKWDEELFRAVMFSLAEHITMQLNGKVNLQNRLNQKANEVVLLALTSVANEESVRTEQMPHSLSVRGYETPPVHTTYRYPYAILNSVSA